MGTPLFFSLAGLHISVAADRPFSLSSFGSHLHGFQSNPVPYPDLSIRHFFHTAPRLDNLGRKLYAKAPWIIFQNDHTFTYFCTTDGRSIAKADRVAFVDTLHRHIDVFHISNQSHFPSLTLMPTDQVFLVRALPFLDGMLVHGAGIVWRNAGLAFLGHSGAGKSTMLRLLTDAEILCDDRIVFRQSPDGTNVFGTWSHGEIPIVSGAGAPLRGLFFLEKSRKNEIVPLANKRDAFFKLVQFLILPMVSKEWWEKVLDVAEKVVATTPAYVVRFDRSGNIRSHLEKLLY